MPFEGWGSCILGYSVVELFSFLGVGRSWGGDVLGLLLR